MSSYGAAGYLEAEWDVLFYENNVSRYLQGRTSRDGDYRSAHIVLWVEKQKAAVSDW